MRPRQIRSVSVTEFDMISPEDELRIKETHHRYYQALGTADWAALGEIFTFPAVFKGFVDEVLVATDASSLATTFAMLIAATPQAERTDILSMDATCVRSNTYMLDMSYVLYDMFDAPVHEGRAIYFMNRVLDDFKIFAIM